MSKRSKGMSRRKAKKNLMNQKELVIVKPKKALGGMKDANSVNK